MGRLFYLHCVRGDARRASQLVLKLPLEIKARLKVSPPPARSTRCHRLQDAILEHLVGAAERGNEFLTGAKM